MWVRTEYEWARVCYCVKIGGILDASFFKNFLKIDCDTNLEASTGTSCGCQPPHKKQRLSSHPLSSSPPSSSSSATSSLSSAIVSSIIAGNNIIKDEPNTRNPHFDSPSTSSGISGKMQEQGSQNSSNGKCIHWNLPIFFFGCEESKNSIRSTLEFWENRANYQCQCETRVKKKHSF